MSTKQKYELIIISISIHIHLFQVRYLSLVVRNTGVLDSLEVIILFSTSLELLIDIPPILIHLGYFSLSVVFELRELVPENSLLTLQVLLITLERFNL